MPRSWSALEGCEHCRAVLPVDWKISEDTVVQPDNLVVCGEVTTEAYLNRPPLLVFEVLSPPTEQKDRVVKSELYAEQEGGVTCWWIRSGCRRKEWSWRGGAYRLRMTLREGVWRCDLGECEITFEFGRIWRV